MLCFQIKGSCVQVPPRFFFLPPPPPTPSFFSFFPLSVFFLHCTFLFFFSHPFFLVLFLSFQHLFSFHPPFLFFPFYSVLFTLPIYSCFPLMFFLSPIFFLYMVISPILPQSYATPTWVWLNHRSIKIFWLEHCVCNYKTTYSMCMIQRLHIDQ